MGRLATLAGCFKGAKFLDVAVVVCVSDRPFALGVAWTFAVLNFGTFWREYDYSVSTTAA
jgi:hypothetical protein